MVMVYNIYYNVVDYSATEQYTILNVIIHSIWSNESLSAGRSGVRIPGRGKCSQRTIALGTCDGKLPTLSLVCLLIRY